MITLENEQLKIKINAFGAELQSVVDKRTDYEFMWQADADYWGRHAPVLFPIVGRLKEDQYKYQGQTYEMTQHGFARDSEFEIIESAKDSVTFVLRDTEDTLEIYPFAFALYIQYILENNRVQVKYKVVNPSQSEELYYAVGGHPAFNVSQTNEEFDQISFEIITEEEITHFPLSEEGLIKAADANKVTDERVNLSHETFKNDALVYEIGKGKTIELKDAANHVSIQMETANLPYVGIWSPYPARASFVCIEPWAGIADTEDTTGEYTEKMGINILEPSQESSHDYSMVFTKN